MSRVKLVASLVVRNELDRYLPEALRLLAGFCDRIVVLDDNSTDGTAEALRQLRAEGLPLTVVSAFETTFYVHEGEIRQRAIDLALQEDPTHVLVIDGDELVGNGAAVRHALERSPAVPAFSLCMEEVWKATLDGIEVREDGGWRAHPVTVCYRVDAYRGGKIRDQKLGGGRVPEQVGRERRALQTDGRILHMGWTRVAEREARHARYVQHDGGAFHASQHLDSIMWPDSRVRLNRCEWPHDFTSGIVGRVVGKANRG